MAVLVFMCTYPILQNSKTKHENIHVHDGNGPLVLTIPKQTQYFQIIVSIYSTKQSRFQRANRAHLSDYSVNIILQSRSVDPLYMMFVHI